MGNLADLTNSLADKDQVIGSVIDNLTSVLSAIGSHDTELSDLIVQLQGFISGLSQDRATIGNVDRRDQRALDLDGRPADQRARPAGQGHHGPDRADRAAQPQQADDGIHLADTCRTRSAR